MHIIKHVERLSEIMGPRPLGSQANQVAGEYIRDVFTYLNLEVEMQELPCPAWEDGGAWLSVDGKRLPVQANTWSLPCNVRAPASALGTLEELRAAELSGRIAVFYGDLTAGGGLGARSAFYFPEGHQELVRLLEGKGPAAVITINLKSNGSEHLIRDWEFPFPSATVFARDGLALMDHIDGDLNLKIDGQRLPGRFHNVIARQPGRNPQRVIILAHFDTQAGSPGASDNATGVAALLGLAQRLAGANLPVSLEWLAVNGEEVGGVGDAVYLERGGQTLDQAVVAINMDYVGQRLGANTITMMGCSEVFQERVRQVHQSYPGVLWGDPWYESDHTAFLMRGVPAIPLGGIGVSDVHHCPSDTLEWVGAKKLDEVVDLVAGIVASLGEEPPEWYRPQGD